MVESSNQDLEFFTWRALVTIAIPRRETQKAFKRNAGGGQDERAKDPGAQNFILADMIGATKRV
jgi:hypothetical protein